MVIAFLSNPTEVPPFWPQELRPKGVIYTQNLTQPERVRQLFEEMAAHHGFWIRELEVAKDHVLIGFSPKNSIAKVVGILKAVRAREIRKELSEVRWEE